MREINILLFLSDYKKLKVGEDKYGATEEEYKLAGSQKSFKGIQTNDAPIEYLFSKAEENEGYVKRVLCITSHKVLTSPEDEPQLDRFKKFIDGLLTRYEMPNKPEYVLIPYDYDEHSHENVNYGENLPAMIYDKLSECFQTVTSEEEVYIDYTGGFRDINFLMTSIIRFLEFKGIKCSEIVYSNLKDKQLCDLHYIYDIYQMINGVNEFTNTGNARELQKAYENVTGNGLADNVLKHLVDFSDMLSICDIGNLDGCVNELIEALRQVEESPCADITSSMLKTLAPTIREKMHLSSGLDYPRMIQWCAENNMIQQAATIYTDKMPIYYFNNGLIPDYVELARADLSLGSYAFSGKFYEEIFNRAAEGLEVKTFRDSLSGILPKPSDSMERNAFVNILKNQRNNENGQIRTAYNRLIGFIERCYERDGINKKPGASYSVYQKLKYDPQDPAADVDGYVKVDGSIPDTFRTFREELISGSRSSWLHQFLYNKENDYLIIATPSRRNKDKLLRKKVFGIQRIKDGTIHLGAAYDRERTYKIMAYYLAVKIMRNRMNHAGEGGRSSDEEAAITALNALGIGIHFEDKISYYKKILLDGISL